MTRILSENASHLRPGEYVHVPELGVYRAKDKAGRVDAFKSEDDAKAHTKRDPLARLSPTFKKIVGTEKHQNAYGFRYKGQGSGPLIPKLKITKEDLDEEAAANAVGGGAVAGLGVGAQGEPPVKKKKVLKRFSEAWSAEDRKKLADEFEASTHRKGKKFQPPHYVNNSGKGHHWLDHGGKTHHWDGTGTNIKTGEKAYRYTARDDNDNEVSRVRVSPKGKIDKEW